MVSRFVGILQINDILREPFDPKVNDKDAKTNTNMPMRFFDFTCGTGKSPS